MLDRSIQYNFRIFRKAVRRTSSTQYDFDFGYEIRMGTLVKESGVIQKMWTTSDPLDVLKASLVLTIKEKIKAFLELEEVKQNRAFDKMIHNVEEKGNQLLNPVDEE